MCDNYDFRPKYWYEHTLGQHILTFTNTNLFGMKFFGKYNYKYIWIKFLKQKQIQLFSCLLKMGEYEHEYNYANGYLGLWIQIEILSHSK